MPITSLPIGNGFYRGALPARVGAAVHELVRQHTPCAIAV